jgi:RES domain-containing protein
VPIERFLRPWAGATFRHVPAQTPFDPLDFRFAGLSDTNRWNRRGQRTLYLAGDRGVAVAEFARHMHEDRSPFLAEAITERRIYRVDVTFDRTLDLRDPGLIEHLSIDNSPACFLDRSVAGAVADFLRATTPVQALIVPSVAFLDDSSRFVFVCFLERLPSEPARWVSSFQPAGVFTLTDQRADTDQ